MATDFILKSDLTKSCRKQIWSSLYLLIELMIQQILVI